MKAATFLVLLFIFAGQASASDAITTEGAACAALKKQAEPIHSQTQSLVSEWRCDFSDDPTPAFYLMALRAQCHDPDGCESTLLGWYALRKSDGQAFEWDVGEDELGQPLLKRW